METLRYVVMVNGLLAVVSLTYFVLLRRETFFGANRLALWLGLTAALILPLVELPDWRPQPVRTVMHRTAQVIVPNVLPNAAEPQSGVTITFPDGRTFPAFQKHRVPVGWSWQEGLISLYIVGVLWLLIRLVRQLISVKNLIWQSTHEPYDGFTLVQTEAVTSPFSFFNWVVLNSEQHTPDELEQILRHERVHVREWHSLDMLGAELVCIVFWFNPAAYLFRHLLHQTLEFSADRAVLAEGVDVKLYQYNLLKVSLLGGQSVITNHFSGPALRQRIRMINRRRSYQINCLRYGLLFLAVFTVAFACQLVHTDSSHKYIRQSSDVFFSIITAETSNQDLDTLRQELIRRNIKLDITKLIRLANGHIQQLTVNLQVPKPGHPMDANVGSSVGQSPIPAIGLRCDKAGCHLGSVDGQFPKQLLTLAIQEGSKLSSETLRGSNSFNDANSVFGLYRVFYRNDFLESNYFGLRTTAIHMTSDYHLDLYPEYQKAVVFLDGREVGRAELARVNVLDLKKVVVFKGEAAVLRLGDVRAKDGLILLSRLHNIAIRDKYAATGLLEIAYPQLFTQP
ncbi:M56 family metallopeptidase [Spirosoma areae]